MEKACITFVSLLGGAQSIFFYLTLSIVGVSNYGNTYHFTISIGINTALNLNFVPVIPPPLKQVKKRFKNIDCRARS